MDEVEGTRRNSATIDHNSSKIYVKRAYDYVIGDNSFNSKILSSSENVYPVFSKWSSLCRITTYNPYATLLSRTQRTKNVREIHAPRRYVGKKIVVQINARTSESSTGLCISFCRVDWAPSVRCHFELLLVRFEWNLDMDFESDLQDLEKYGRFNLLLERRRATNDKDICEQFDAYINNSAIYIVLYNNARPAFLTPL